MEHRDVIVIGGGPAGLTAGIYLTQYGFNAIILEEKIAGGYAAEIPLLENYPGYIKGISGKDLVDQMVLQCEELGVEIHQFEKVKGLDFQGKLNIVNTDKSDYSALSVFIASGRNPKLLGLPGEYQFRGKGVSHCAVCDGFFFKDKEVVVVGEDQRAIEVAIFLSGLASHVKMICHQEKLCAEKILLKDLEIKKVEILNNVELKEIKGDLKVKSVVLLDKATGNKEEIPADGIFFQQEGVPNSQIAKKPGIKLDKDGYILADERGRTNIQGVYAMGDVTSSPTKLVVTAVAQAAAAAYDVMAQVHSQM
jgi:thioredoxin reductase (NADPH)